MQENSIHTDFNTYTYIRTLASLTTQKVLNKRRYRQLTISPYLNNQTMRIVDSNFDQPQRTQVTKPAVH